MMKSVRISSRALIVPGRGGGWSPKATRREDTGGCLLGRVGLFGGGCGGLTVV